MPTWTEDDIEVLYALPTIPKIRSLFVSPEGDCSLELTSHLIEDAITLGATDVAIAIMDRWYIVHSSFDWLRHGIDEPIEILFQKLLSLEGGGVNSCRKEVVVAALCSSVCTGINGAALPIKGEIDEALFAFLGEKVPPSHRYVAFKY